MSKYIDAEKLIAEIERRKKQDVTFRERSLLIDMENAIASLQHEHPYFDKVREIKTGRVFLAEYSSEAAEWYEAGTGKAYSISDVEIVKQEQQEVDLEKFTEKIKTFQGRYKHPEIVSIKGAMAFMARMFYQYPNVARQWYDSLPKATMD